MRTPRSTPLLLAIALAAPAAASAQRTTGLPARDRVLQGTPEQVWAVGTDEGESWEMFASISQLAFDDHDNLYVLDQGNARILMFDAQGRFVRQFGKQGGGPGEFQYPASLNITRDGRIAVYDMMRRGYSLFDARGNYIEHIALPEGYGSPRPGELFAHPEGGIVARTMPNMTLQSPVPTDSVASPIFHQMLGGEAVSRTLYEFKMPPPNVQTRDAGGGRSIRMVAFSRPTFAVEPSWGVLPDGRIAISQDPDYRISVLGRDGSTSSVITRPIRARDVTRRDQDDAREQQRLQLREGGGGGVRVATSSGSGTAVFRAGSGGISAGGGEMTDDQIEEIVGRMQFADRIPAIQGIVVDPIGRIWVRRRPERVGRDEPIDLVSGDGRYIGTIVGLEMPRAVSPSGLAAWIEKNELDIEQVVVRRLPGTWK